jgi:hypothetical protein
MPHAYREDTDEDGPTIMDAIDPATGEGGGTYETLSKLFPSPLAQHSFLAGQKISA